MILIDTFNRYLGKLTAWLSFGMVIVMFGSVIQRYLLESNYIWQQELIQYMHAILFLCAAAYTLQKDKHVRVDVLYEGFSALQKARVNLFGIIVFLVPVTAAIAYLSYDFIAQSWSIMEHSREPGGLPGVFLLKTVIGIFAISILFQGISQIVSILRKYGLKLW